VHILEISDQNRIGESKGKFHQKHIKKFGKYIDIEDRKTYNKESD